MGGLRAIMLYICKKPVFGEYLKNYQLYEKNFQIKVIGNFCLQKKCTDENFNILSRFPGNREKPPNICIYRQINENIGKTIDFPENCFKQKLLELIFPKKNVHTEISISPAILRKNRENYQKYANFSRVRPFKHCAFWEYWSEAQADDGFWTFLDRWIQIFWFQDQKPKCAQDIAIFWPKKPFFGHFLWSFAKNWPVLGSFGVISLADVEFSGLEIERKKIYPDITIFTAEISLFRQFRHYYVQKSLVSGWSWP